NLLQKNFEIGNSLPKSLGVILEVVDAAGGVGTSELFLAGRQLGLQAIAVARKGLNLGLGAADPHGKCMPLAPASGQLVLQLLPLAPASGQPVLHLLPLAPASGQPVLQLLPLAPESGQLFLELSPGRGMNNYVAHTFQSPEQELFHCPAPSLAT